MSSGASSTVPSTSRLPDGLRVLAMMAAVLVWVYWTTFVDLAHRWGSQSQYSHGWLVPLFSAYLLWSRRQMLDAGPLAPSWWGMPMLLLGLGLRFVGVYTYFDWLAAASLLPCLAAACLLVGGWRALRWAWPAIAFLVFMIPLPFRFEAALSHPLQRIGTIMSTFTLQTIGMTAYAEGNVIVLGEVRIGVVEACSGLNMLMTFFALSTGVTILMQRSPLERVIVFVSAVPIALATNILRIVTTAILHKVAGRELADLVFHDLAGYLMPVVALGMLWVLLRLLDWLLLPPEEGLNADALGWTNAVHTGALQGLAPANGGPAPGHGPLG
jgi:exosortase